MLDLHPDKFKVEWARVLLSAGIEPITTRELTNAIERRFKKHYPVSEKVAGRTQDGLLLKLIDELCTCGLMERVSARKTLVQVTRYGLEHVGMIEYLARTRPDPYRKFTRPSYSPNCQPADAPPETDIPIPAPTSWEKEISLSAHTW